MEWIILEALVALALGLVIVWWTLAPARKAERDAQRRSAERDAPGDHGDAGEGDA